MMFHYHSQLLCSWRVDNAMDFVFLLW